MLLLMSHTLVYWLEARRGKKIQLPSIEGNEFHGVPDFPVRSSELRQYASVNLGIYSRVNFNIFL